MSTTILNDVDTYGPAWMRVAERLGNYESHDRDAAEILDLLGVEPCGQALVDAGCGPGHHAAAFHRLGLSVMGLDISPEVLDEAWRRSPGPRYLQFDLTQQIPAGIGQSQQDILVSLYSSFGYGATGYEDERMLANFRRLLKPGGRLVLHLSDLDRSRHRLGSDAEPVVRETNGVTETLTVDFRTGMLHVRYELGDEVVDSRIRMYECHDLVAMLARVGFEDIRRLGGFDGRPKSPQDRLVLVARA